MLLQKVSNIIFNRLTLGKVSISGRNNSGKITIRHRGGASAHKFRFLDFFHYIWNVNAFVLSAHYDANRTALISLTAYSNGILALNLLSNYLLPGTIVSNINLLKNHETRYGYCANVNFIRPGLSINSVELRAPRGAQYIRSAGTAGKLVSVTDLISIIKLRSKTLIKVSNFSTASIGPISSVLDVPNYTLQTVKKAGYSRRKGIRPTVRGVAMNPIDHPHGGGQGKTSGGRPSVTPWAEITKGKKTRNKINYGSFILETKHN